MDKKVLGDVWGSFLIWRFFLFGVTILGASVVPKIPNGSPYSALSPQGYSYFYSWAQWDGWHYIDIAQNGYQDVFNTAFLPLYPLLIKATSFITGNLAQSAFLVSNAAFFLALVFFQKLLVQDFPPQLRRRCLLALIAFPTSFFFGGAYSESLFLLLILASLYCARVGRWGWSSLLAAFASGTRIVGVFLLPALIWEYLQQKRFKYKMIRSDILLLFLAPFGLLLYMAFLAKVKGDPLIFLRVQGHWGRDFSSPSEPLINALSKIFSSYPISAPFFYNFMEVTFLALAIGSAVFVMLKARVSYAIFSLAVILVPLFSGTLVSMPRYVLPAFTTYIFLAALSKGYFWGSLISFLSIGLLALLSTLFVNGYWVS